MLGKAPTETQEAAEQLWDIKNRHGSKSIVHYLRGESYELPHDRAALNDVVETLGTESTYPGTNESHDGRQRQAVTSDSARNSYWRARRCTGSGLSITVKSSNTLVTGRSRQRGMGCYASGRIHVPASANFPSFR